MISPRVNFAGLIILAVALLSKPLLWAEWEGSISTEILAHVAEETPSGFFLATLDDTILRAVDAESPLTSVHDASERVNAIGHNAASTVVAVGNNGYITYSSNGGDTWQTATLSEPLLGDLQGVAYGGGSWVAVGSGADGITVLRSTDGASTWSHVSSPGEGVLNGVTWNGSIFYAAGGDLFEGILLSSANGSSWAEVSVPGDFGLLNFVVSDSTGAFLAGGEQATLIRSNGNASNLQLLSVDLSGDLTTAVTVDAGHWLVGGSELTVFEIKDGGQPNKVFGAVEGAASADALAITGADSFLIFGDFSSFFRPLELRVDRSNPGVVSIRVANLIWGDRYVLQRSSNLATWEGQETITANGLTYTWILSVPTGQQSHFYRVIPE